MYNQKLILSSLLLLCACYGRSQSVAAKLATAIQQMEADPQLKHAIVSLCVADAQTGKTIYAHHEQTGLAPASSQKIFTSVAAFDLLGATYRYKTIIGYDGSISNGTLNGSLQIKGSGDPTLGSWRYKETKDELVLGKITTALQSSGITSIGKDVILNDEAFGVQSVPGGWIWDDIGNYYGAGCWAINWHENQYDMQLKPGANEGDATTIIGMPPAMKSVDVLNLISTGKKGSGDNGYIYVPPYATLGFTQGTIPAGAASFEISGSFPYATAQFMEVLKGHFNKQKVTVNGNYKMGLQKLSGKLTIPAIEKTIATIESPTLDSIVYWFLKKSINLYGEALIRTMAYEKTGTGTTEKGVELLRNFWSERGIEKSAINIMDGSGLSPQNRVTTDAEVKVLQYAKNRSWYNAFYQALPEYNGMRMKSGTIGGSKAFAGYHKNYIFSIIVNNFDGSASGVVKKMYKVLDILK